MAGLHWLQGSKLRRAAAVVGVVALTFALGYAWRLHGALEVYRQARQISLEQRDAHRQRAASALTHERAISTESDLQARLQRARWRLAAGADRNALLEQLSATGRSGGLLFERLDIGDRSDEGSYYSIPLALHVTGSYLALRQWLDAWMGQPRVLQPRQLRLEPVADQAGLLRLRLDLLAYEAPDVLTTPEALADLPAHASRAPPVHDPFAVFRPQATAHDLAAIPLERLEMVGTLARAGEYQALVRNAGRLYRVRVGDRLGRNDGIAVHIDAAQIEVQERMFVAGRWQIRSSFLGMNPAGGKEAREREQNDIGLDGAGAVPVGTR